MKITGFVGKYKEPGEENESRSSKGSAVSSPTPESGKVRPDASFKIKDSLRQVSQAQPVVKIHTVAEKQIERITAHEEIRMEKVAEAIEKYIAEHRPEPTVAIALRTHRPEVEQDCITIAVDNQLQLEKMETLKVHLQNAFMKSLNNGFLTLTFKMFDVQTAKEEKKLFTAGEKFEHFLKLNPVVGELKKVFGLELD